MKVRDLIAKLQKADPDMDVYAAPLTQFPTETGRETLIDPFKKYPISSVAQIMKPEDTSSGYISIGFDEDTPQQTVDDIDEEPFH